MQDFSNQYYVLKDIFLPQTDNVFYDIYQSTTIYPYSFLVPFFLSFFIVLFGYFLASLFNFRNPKYRFIWQFVLTNVFVFLGGLLVSAILFGLIKHLSPFWMVAFIFFGMQVILPMMLIAMFIRDRFGKQCKIFKSFKYLGKKMKKVFLVYGIIMISISAYAFFIEPNYVEVTEQQYNCENFDESIKVVHLTDIQTEHLGSREKNLVKTVNEIKPDMIVITGDYFAGDYQTHVKAFNSARYVLENLDTPKYGIYGVSSDSNTVRSHEPLFEGIENAFYLENEQVEIDVNGEKLNIVGLDRKNPDVDKAFLGLGEEDNVLVLYHGPELFFYDRLRSYKPDLMLVGHTHGGQIALPFIGPLTSATIYGSKYAKGWFEEGGFSMYVNRGFGLEGNWAPKIRFLTRPEIAVFELK